MKSTIVWIATPGFALLAMTEAGFFSSLLEISEQPRHNGALIIVNDPREPAPSQRARRRFGMTQ